jgi:hypothetical protein
MRCANCHSIVKDFKVDNSGDTLLVCKEVVYVYRQILLDLSFFICTPFFNILLVTATYKMFFLQCNIMHHYRMSFFDRSKIVKKFPWMF